MQEFFFRQADDETYAIMGYQGDEAEVVIPATHGGKPVTILFDDLFEGHKEIVSVEIPNTVTNLGEFLFSGCENLRRISLPESLESIWPYAFAYSGIDEITLPDSLTSIAPFTFKDCKNLRKVVCGAGMKKIHGKAFLGCEKLTEFHCGQGVEINKDAFEECDSFPVEQL